jgi:hypothetical protein
MVFYSIWATETSQFLQSKDIDAQIDGFDVSTAQFPPPAWLPANVALYLHDVFEPYPEEFRGKFDLVQIRAFTSFLTPENVDTLMRHLTSLLSKAPD